MATPPGFSPPARALVTAAALVIVAVGVQLASPVLAPILLAVCIAVVATPAALVATAWLAKVAGPVRCGLRAARSR